MKPENQPANPPTLDNVAEAAGVSTATVSRCINEPGVVSAPTRQKVQAAIDALGYTPNFAARSMAAKRTFTIGAIVPTMENSIFARGLQAFQEELDRLGYTLLVSSNAYDPQAEEKQIRNLVARGADGLLLIGHEREPKVYDYLERQRVPAIAAWAFDAKARLASIGFDNRAAMQALTEEVIGLGHSRIAMISGISRHNDRVRMRLEGVRSAMAARGLDADTLSPFEAAYDFAAGERAISQIMDRDHRPSVVICGNDVLAAGALLGARKRGLHVPHDVSITGFDDIELARIVTPELTTVHVPHRSMGTLAAQEIVGMIKDNRAGISQKLDAHIVHRASLAPPAGC